MLTLYKSLVRGHLEFSCPLWSPHDIASIQQIEDVQKTFTREISGLQSLDYWARLQALHLMSLQRRRERYSIIHVWKIVNNMAPNDIGLQFTNSDRRGIRVHICAMARGASQAAKTLYDKSFAIHAAKLWNTIPEKATVATKLCTFKKLLGEFLKSFPDNPPVRGYHAQNNNSIIEWYQSGGSQQAQWPR